MKNTRNNKSGFTLLELLVVVLIISILAAIALPQYQYAVMKSRFATLKQNTKVMISAMKRYFLVNNKYPSKLSDLDIEINDNKNTYSWNGTCINAYQKNDISLGYWVCPSSETNALCVFETENQSKFDKLDAFCKKEVQSTGGRRGCSSTTSCYYYYYKK